MTKQEYEIEVLATIQKEIEYATQSKRCCFHGSVSYEKYGEIASTLVKLKMKILAISDYEKGNI